MTDTCKNLSNMLASGETEKTLSTLKSIFEKIGDVTHLSDVVILTNRFNQNKNSFHRGILSHADFNLENNKITEAISNLIEKVSPSTGILRVKKTEGLKTTRLKWASILFIFAMVMAVMIYKSQHQLFLKKEPTPAEQPTIMPPDSLQQTVLSKDTASAILDQPKKTAKPVEKNGDIHFINNGKMEKTVVGNNNKVDIQ